MKHSPFHAMTLKKFFSYACFATFITAASVNNATAQKTTDSTAASVSYLGYADDQFSFLMKYENEKAERFTVTITDSDGHMLYNEFFTDKKFNKVFKTHLETGSLTFVISNPKKKEEKRFRVNTQRHIAEEFSITKAN